MSSGDGRNGIEYGTGGYAGYVLSVHLGNRNQTTENFIKIIPRSLSTEYLPIERI
jgi:hypothetical protein